MDIISAIIWTLCILIWLLWIILLKEWWDDTKNKTLKEALLDIIKPEDDVAETLVKYSFFGGTIYFTYLLFSLVGK